MPIYTVFYLAASFSYINTICWVRFGLFIAFYTGNLVIAILAFAKLAWKEAAFRIVVILSHTVIGVKISQFIGEKVRAHGGICNAFGYCWLAACSSQNLCYQKTGPSWKSK